MNTVIITVIKRSIKKKSLIKISLIILVIKLRLLDVSLRNVLDILKQ